MKTALSALLVAGLFLPAATRAAEKPAAEALGWLAGTWSFERNGRKVTEHWLPPEGGTLMGVSRTTANGRTVEYEFLLIRADEAGDLHYVAKPSGQAEHAFKLVRLTATEAVFEDPAHDFPQRIIYTLREDGSLLAAIEGLRNGQLRRVEFPYRRVER